MHKNNNNISHVPQVNEAELLQVKEKYFNEFTALSGRHSDNSYRLMSGLQELFESIYTAGFKSGYGEKELEIVIDNKKAR